MMCQLMQLPFKFVEYPGLVTLAWQQVTSFPSLLKSNVWFCLDNASAQAAVQEIVRIRNPYGTTRLAWGVLGVMMIFWDLVATWTQWHTYDVKGGRY